jgi:hypothetical protein
MGVQTMDLMAQGRSQGIVGSDLLFCGCRRLHTLDGVYQCKRLAGVCGEGIAWIQVLPEILEAMYSSRLPVISN